MAFGYSQPTSAADPANLHSSIGHIISWLSLKAIEGFKFSFFPHTANNYSHSAAFYSQTAVIEFELQSLTVHSQRSQ